MDKTGRPSTQGRPDTENILGEYHTKTAAFLAAKYGVSEGTIRRWVREAREQIAGGKTYDTGTD